MALFIPKVVYSSTTLTFTQWQKIWVPRARPVGGSAVSDGGVPEAFIVRREQLCEVELRFLESEWVSVDTWLAYAQGAQSFDYWFDNTDIATKYTCYLDDPKLGSGEVKPKRDPYLGVLSINSTLRTTNNSRFNQHIFGS